MSQPADCPSWTAVAVRHADPIRTPGRAEFAAPVGGMNLSPVIGQDRFRYHVELDHRAFPGPARVFLAGLWKNEPVPEVGWGRQRMIRAAGRGRGHARREAPGVSSVCVVTEDVDAVHDAARGAGAEDPEGNLWSFGTCRGAP